MERLPKLVAQELVDRMRGEFEQLMTQVAQAVNDAPQGRVIVGSEEQVRDLLGEFRRLTFQTALQMRVDAAEAAFSPGGPRNP
jgi:alkanesulfonate monooxygenase SsuD/methylene tetrahydromethanopterin reductase-like flavin-dependent oxidoreductase (luciferase family)